MFKINVLEKPNEKQYVIFSGKPRYTLPVLINSGMKLANFEDVAREITTSPLSEDKKKLLYLGVTLPGNPILARDDERVIVYNLENSSLRFLKEFMKSIDEFSKVNETDSISIEDNLYDKVKRSNGTFVIEKNLVKKLKSTHGYYADREKIFANCCRDESVKECYFNFLHEKENEFYKRGFNNINLFDIYLGDFQGLRFLELSTLHSRSRQLTISDGLNQLDDEYEFFAINKGIDFSKVNKISYNR